MIDLHLHLDGSLSKQDFEYLAARQNVNLGDKFPDNIYVPNDCKSLEEYLERFDLPLTLLQDEFSLAYATNSLIERLYKMGYIYAEIRFAPQLHTRRGMSQEDAVISVLAGLHNALKNKPDFDAGIILCCMRQADFDTNVQAIELAKKYSKNGVVAVDLAGPEAFKRADNYTKLFDLAHEYGLNITLHAGEACGSSEVEMAVDLLHAQRIGHGVHLDINPVNVKKMVEKRIAFEFCPTSNLQTKSLSGYDKVPLRVFDGYGILVTINSDNMTVSNTDVIQEYRHLVREFKLQDHEIKHFLINSINAAFVDVNKKQALRRELDRKFNSFLDAIYQRR